MNLAPIPLHHADQAPRCDKCGAEITTGLMAAFCPQQKECKFYTPELDDFMADLGLVRKDATY